MKESSDPKSSKASRKSWVNIDDIRVLMDLIRDTDVSELEVEKAGTRVRIKKSGASGSYGMRRTKDTVSAAVSPAASKQGLELEGPEVKDDNYYNVSSPIVGTFYRAPSPEKDPYVNVGDTVKKGQILCIIEAMKLMNEIESEIDGKIAEILVQDTQPVEYGEVLFKIEPIH